MKRAIVAIAPTEAQAHAIVDELRSGGFLAGDLSILFPDRGGTRSFGHDAQTEALFIPGLGPFVAAGPIVAALSGGVLGAVTLGIAAALVGMGIAEVEAKRYEGKIRGGNVLVTVHVDDPRQRAYARDILARNGARDIATTFEPRADVPPRAAPPSRPSRSH